MSTEMYLPRFMRPGARTSLAPVIKMQDRFQAAQKTEKFYFDNISEAEVMGVSFVLDAGLLIPGQFCTYGLCPDMGYTANVENRGDFLSLENYNDLSMFVDGRKQFLPEKAFDKYASVCFNTQVLIEYINRTALETMPCGPDFLRGKFGRKIAKFVQITEMRGIPFRIVLVSNLSRISNIEPVKLQGFDCRFFSYKTDYDIVARKRFY